MGKTVAVSTRPYWRGPDRVQRFVIQKILPTGGRPFRLGSCSNKSREGDLYVNFKREQVFRLKNAPNSKGRPEQKVAHDLFRQEKVA